MELANVLLQDVSPKKNNVGSFSKYIQAFAYTSTVLFHMIPAITDFLRRLPVEDPFAESFDDPLILSFYLLFISIYSIGLFLQIRWLSKEI